MTTTGKRDETNQLSGTEGNIGVDIVSAEDQQQQILNGCTIHKHHNISYAFVR